jgi:hypothetical protein
MPLEQGLPLLERRAVRARRALYVYLGVLPFSVMATAAEIMGWVDIETETPDIRSMVAVIVMIITLIIMIVTTVLVAMWIYRAHAILKFTRAEGPTMDPTWAVGWYFIPIANLFKPYDAMRQLWTRSGTDAVTGQGRGILNVWWGSWIVASILGNASALPSSSPDILRLTPMLAMISDGMMMLAGWSLTRIIAAITEAQTSRLGVASTFG